MGISKSHAVRNRKIIVDTAARIFRERGIDGVGVADLMQEAGFTHGGFYNHFKSKEALAAEALDAAYQESCQSLVAAVKEDPENGQKVIEFIVNGYLSKSARDSPSTACPTSALVVDASRHRGPIQEAYTEAVENLLNIIILAMKQTGMRGGTRALRNKSIGLFSGMIGAIVLSRALSGTNENLSDEVLSVARKQLTM